MGRRVQKIVYTYETDSWSPITEYQFIYDGWNLIKQTTTPEGGSSVDKYYIWGLDLSQSLQGAGGVGGLLASVQGSLTTHYCYDANGNVTQLVDGSDGSLAAHYEYDPFGNTVVAVGTMADDNVYRFSTKFFDQEISLYYYGYRYYSAELSRWTNRDPMGEKGGINLYSFVSNQQINKIDLLGKKLSDLRIKLAHGQVPKAEGLSAGALAAFPQKILSIIGGKIRSLIAGRQAGVYFFADSCEIAAFDIKAGMMRKQSGNDPLYTPNDGGLLDETTMWTTVVPEQLEEIEKHYFPEEEGFYIGGGVSVELATYVGDASVGEANANSFKGIFHTVELGWPAPPVGLYAGGKKGQKIWNGNWVGITYGSVGPALGGAEVYWDYVPINPFPLIKLDKTKIGECFCHMLILQMP